MTFIDQRLPQQVEIAALRRERSPIEIVRTDGGHEVRNARHAQTEITYEVSFPPGGFDDSIISAVFDMWRASAGGLYAFRFRDWDIKNNALSDEAIGVKDGATTAFQITKTHTVGGVSRARNITRPVSPITVKLNGVVQSSGYTVNYDTGILTFSSGAGSQTITVSGVYDIPVRFDMNYEATGVTGFLEHIDTLTLIEVKE